MRAFFKFFASLAVIGATAVCVFSVYKNPFFKIQSVTVHIVKGNQQKFLFQKIAQDIRPYVMQLKGKWLLGVGLDSIADKIKSDARVKDVVIHRNWLGRLDIAIEPRDPILVLLNHHNRFIPIARDASLLPAAPGFVDLPILRGQEFFAHKDLREQAVKLWSALPATGPMRPKTVSEIHYSQKKGFFVYLTNSGAEVRLGKDHFIQRVSFVERVLNYLHSRQLQGRVIDARFSKKVVVRLRNAP